VSKYSSLHRRRPVLLFGLITVLRGRTARCIHVARLFDDVVRPAERLGVRRFTVPVSVAVHVGALLVLVVVPLLAMTCPWPWR
jgi:hypothetical protein